MSYKKDSLGDRMKSYENDYRFYLDKKSPVIVRIDGRAFHTFTKGFQKPFDDILISTMQDTAKYLCENIMGCKLAYTQSDEISLLLVDYDRDETQPWFNNNLQKIVSVASSMATMEFEKNFFNHTLLFIRHHNLSPMEYFNFETLECARSLDEVYLNAHRNGAMFDARAFTLPKEEVCNYFIWRQQDATRNSIQMVAQSLFSHRQLQNKNCDQLQEMMFQEHNINWNDYPTVYKRGSCVTKEQYTENDVTRSRWVVDTNIPIFTQDRNYIDRLVFLDV